MGIGSIPGTILSLLNNHKDIGIHTELLSSEVCGLIEKNVITNSRKSMDKGKVVTSFAMGTREFYDMLNDNPLFG